LPSLADGRKMGFPHRRTAASIYLLAPAPPANGSTIVFFGGEPLTGTSRSSSSLRYAEVAAEARRTAPGFVPMTTNATLLTAGLIDYFYAHRFGISSPWTDAQADS